MGAPIEVKAGEGPTGSNRWGDYSGAGVDPADQTVVWVAGEYEKSDGAWGTWIARLRAGFSELTNDNFSSATAITSLPSHFTVNTSNASTEANEPTGLTGCTHASSSVPIGKTVWYRFVSASNVSATVTTAGSDFDTVLAVYTGSSLGSLSKIACDDDGVASAGASQLTFVASGGTAYYVQVGGWSGASGTLVIDVSGGATSTDPRQEGPVQIGGNVQVGGRATFTINVKNYGGTATPAMHPYIEGTNTVGQFWRADGAQPPSAVIQPGQTQTFTVYQDMWSAGTWTSNGIFLWDNDHSTYWEPLPANGQNQQFSFQVAPQTFGLSVTRAGSGSGTVTSSPGGINCGADCSESYTSGTPVSLTATPASGSIFTGWGGDCSGTGSCQVTMDAAKSVTATFTLQTFSLTITKAQSGTGMVTSSDNKINCGSICSATYTSGAQATLTATPSNGSTFSGWSGACLGTGTCQVTIDAAKSVTATFQPPAVGVQVGRAPGPSPSGDPVLAANLTARVGCGTIDHIQFGDPGRSFDNAQVTIMSPIGGPAGLTTGFTYTPPAGTTSVALTIQRVSPNGGATVSPIHFFDGCGDWQTFVGGGHDAFR